MKRAIFLTPYPIEGASNRYRIYQYKEHLEQDGFFCDIRPLVTSKFFAKMYTKGNYIYKTLFFLKGFFLRFRDIIDAAKADVVVVHRECFPLGPPIFEWLMYRMKTPLVYDFDDAIFLPYKGIASYLRMPSKIAQIIRYADQITAGNNYLAEYALKFNPSVTVVPTPVKVKPLEIDNKQLVIGWVGSHSTAPYLEKLFPVLKAVAKKVPITLKIVGAGKDYVIPGVEVQNIKWDLNDEKNFQGIDIGVYPLPNNKWTKGKCGFKAIQYMAHGIPVVGSPVGVNMEIIKDGINGFLAHTDEEWYDRIWRLAKSKELQKKFIEHGKNTIKDRYCVDTVYPSFRNSLELAMRTRILHLISSFDIGGTERMLSELLSGLDKKKYRLHACAIIPHGKLTDNISQIPEVSVHLLNAKYKGDLRALFRLWMLIRRQKIDVVHSYLFFDNVLVKLLSICCKIKVITSQRFVVDRESKWRILAGRILSRLGSCTIANSRAAAESSVKYGWSRKETTLVIHNGKSPVSCTPLNLPRPAVGIVAKMRQEKDHHLFLRAASTIRKTHPEVTFFVVGGGPLFSELQQYAKDLGLQDSIVFTGDVLNVYEYIQAFDMLVLTSYMESLPGVILEAMICSKPIVSTRVGGTKELVRDRESGILVDRDEKNIADAVCELIENKQLREHMGKRGRELYEKYFTVARMVTEYEKVYDELSNG